MYPGGLCKQGILCICSLVQLHYWILFELGAILEHPREEVVCVVYFEEVGRGRDWKLMSFNIVLMLKSPDHANNDNIKPNKDYNIFSNTILVYYKSTF